MLEMKVVAAIKAIEELLAELKAMPGVDQRQVAVARTQFETALLWTANAAGGESILS